MQKIIVQGIFKNTNVVVEVEGISPQEIQTEFDEWVTAGFIPANHQPQQKTTARAINQLALDAQAPAANCPVHHKPFRQNSKGNFCATKLEDGTWGQENGKSRQRTLLKVQAPQHPDGATAEDIPF